jgi:hypothetical protein
MDNIRIIPRKSLKKGKYRGKEGATHRDAQSHL